MILFILLAAVTTVSLYVDFKFHKWDHEMTLKESALWSGFWVGVGVLFGLVVWLTMGQESMALYYSGYVMEKALSIDNLVVFIAIFAYFKIQDSYTKHKILMYGLIGAIVFRAIFIVLGTTIANSSPWILFVFGIVVAATAIMMIKGGDEDEEVNYDDKWFVKAVKKVYPVITDKNPTTFFKRVDGKTWVTPLFLCLVAIEVSDILFSFDSVPAVIGITQEPILVYSAVIMAILGLRALYFILGSLMNHLTRLDFFVAIVLFFIAAKLLLTPFGIHFDPVTSLCIVVALLAAGVVVSLIYPKSE